jgi:hypothetical protein
MVGGITPCFIARIVITASILPAAPKRCPIIDLLADIGICLALAPNILLMAAVSVRSFNRVAVPWALI